MQHFSALKKRGYFSNIIHPIYSCRQAVNYNQSESLPTHSINTKSRFKEKRFKNALPFLYIFRRHTTHVFFKTRSKICRSIKTYHFTYLSYTIFTLFQ